jgi:hypothetical protein
MKGFQAPACAVTSGNGSTGTVFHNVLEGTWRNPIIEDVLVQVNPLQRKIRAKRNGKKVEGRLQSFDVPEGG